MQDHKGLSGSHHAFFDSVVGNWELPDFGKYSLISMKNISHLLKENKLKEVDFKDILGEGNIFFPTCLVIIVGVAVERDMLDVI